MGKRGSKTCPKCSLTTGPRSYMCKGCGYDYGIQKGVTKLTKGKNGKAVEDWRELDRGEFIKVVAGSGPYFPLPGGEREPFGYNGLFRIHHRHKDGLLCYSSDRKNSGACFIYMGPEKKSKVGSVLRPHKIRQVDGKYIDSYRRKKNA